MPKLIVAADDLTGALDTGVQFAKHGIETRVFPDGKLDISLLGGAEVAVVNTASRHIPANEAYRIVFDLAGAARKHGFDFFYKKTDSALRGNIGAELSALRDALKEPVAFVPAYPQMGRTTTNGIHYINGLPVAETSFGRDPFTPLASSAVGEILLQSGAKEQTGIEIFDAESDGKLSQIARALKQSEKKIFAGCAGFAAFLPEIIGFRRKKIVFESSTSGLIVVTGSVNPVTLEQVEYAEQSSFSSLAVPKGIKIAHEGKAAAERKAFLEEAAAAFNEKGCLIITSVAAGGKDFVKEGKDSLHKVIACNIGGIAAALMKQLDAAFFLIGGDVLLECIGQLKPDSLQPLSEPIPGVVFVKLQKGPRAIDLYTKSGGFGSRDYILKLEGIRKSKEKRNETE